MTGKIRSMKNLKLPIRNRTRDNMVYSEVPEPTDPPRTALFVIRSKEKISES